MAYAAHDLPNIKRYDIVKSMNGESTNGGRRHALLIALILVALAHPIIHAIVHVAPNAIVNHEIILLESSSDDALVLIFGNLIVEFDVLFLHDKSRQVCDRRTRDASYTFKTRLAPSLALFNSASFSSFNFLSREDI